MNITQEFHGKVEGLRLVHLYDVVVNANRIDFEDEGNGYDLGVKHGVSLLTDRILENFGFERQEIDMFYRWVKALESEDPPVIV